MYFFFGYFEDLKGYIILQPKYKSLSLKYMQSLLKLYWPTSLVWQMYHLSLSLILMKIFLLQTMTTRMKILPHLLRMLLHLLNFQNGFVLLGMQHVLLQVILQINDIHVLNSIELLLYWLKIQRIMILTPLQKLQAIQIGTQL